MATEADLRRVVGEEGVAIAKAVAATAGPQLAAVQVAGHNAQYLVGPGLFWGLPSMTVLNALRKAKVVSPVTVAVTQAELDALKAAAVSIGKQSAVDLAGVHAKLDQLLGRPAVDVDEAALAAALAPLLQDTTPAEAELIAAKFRDALTGGQVVLTLNAAGAPAAASEGES